MNLPTLPLGSLAMEWNGSTFWLLPEKAIFLPIQKAVLIADPHFGKAAHFRKAGIPIPEKVHLQDFLKIQKLIQTLGAIEIYFLGDLFHSDWNTSWSDLEEFASFFAECRFHLVKGNHDILPEQLYRSELWEVHPEAIQWGNFVFSHEPMSEVPDGKYNFCGHVHPGISLYGAAKQKMTLPCFFQKENQLILPAFGRFTGIVGMKCGKNDRAFAVAGKKVTEVKFWE